VLALSSMFQGAMGMSHEHNSGCSASGQWHMHKNFTSIFVGHVILSSGDNYVEHADITISNQEMNIDEYEGMSVESVGSCDHFRFPLLCTWDHTHGWGGDPRDASGKVFTEHRDNLLIRSVGQNHVNFNDGSKPVGKKQLLLWINTLSCQTSVVNIIEVLRSYGQSVHAQLNSSHLCPRKQLLEGGAGKEQLLRWQTMLL
jgi:hypothetical protein